MADRSRVVAEATTSQVAAELARRATAVQQDIGMAVILDWSGNSADALRKLVPAVHVLFGDPDSDVPLGRVDCRELGPVAKGFEAVPIAALAYAHRLVAKVSRERASVELVG